MSAVSFYCYAPRPAAAELSPFDTAILQLIRNERFQRAGLTVRDITIRARSAAQALVPVHSVRRGLARLKKAGLVERNQISDATPYRWKVVRRG